MRQIYCWSLFFSLFVLECPVYLFKCFVRTWVHGASFRADICCKWNMNTVVKLNTLTEWRLTEIENNGGSKEREKHEGACDISLAPMFFYLKFIYANGESLRIIHINRSLRVKVPPITCTPCIMFVIGKCEQIYSRPTLAFAVLSLSINEKRRQKKQLFCLVLSNLSKFPSLNNFAVGLGWMQYICIYDVLY